MSPRSEDSATETLSKKINDGCSAASSAGIKKMMRQHRRTPSSFRLSSLGRPIDTSGPIPCRLWTSTLRRTKETAQFIEHNTIQYTWDNGDTAEWVQFRPMPRRNLDELYAGVCDGLTYKQIEKRFPDEFARRQDDKLAYRYPRGEYR